MSTLSKSVALLAALLLCSPVHADGPLNPGGSGGGAPSGAAGGGLSGTYPNPTVSVVTGTTTNDNAATGKVGEYIEQIVPVGSAVSLTSTIPSNVASISLTAGDWDVSGSFFTSVGGSTTVATIEGSINTVSATLATRGSNNSGFAMNTAFTTGANQTAVLGTSRISISGTTTVYLVAAVAFGVSTCSAYGIIRARRVR